MLEAYLDESERSVLSPRLFAMGAWLGGGPAWRTLEPLWAAVLADPRFAVPEFKSSDYANRRGAFSEWSEDQRTTFLSELLGVVGAADIVGVAVVLGLDVPEDQAARAQKEADYLACAYYSILFLAHVAASSHPEGERIAFVFDERQKVVGNVERARRWLKGKAPGRLAGRVGPAEFDSSVQTLPLQAADLLAYWAHLHRQHDLGRSSERDDGLLRTMSPVLAPKLAIRRLLEWAPGYLKGSTEICDARWTLQDRLPSFDLAHFRKPQMPEASKQAIWDSSWARLRVLIGARPRD